ncbi:MAG: glutathione S-transferase family protein [Gammaproteobacteria bacterium]|nr:glutathione S-transferase family protein [Gammaproteobacteria bacterium]MDH4256694.1 glutathione S-transferase family protein [Gammaproteobacteria bacterium]MDH5309300.1 glutathione S-transferase family protein [Gammaproteobacteria bacterium]
MSVTIIGSYLSPYVRKTLVCLQIKGVDYRIDPIVPFFGNDEFSRVSPLRRIPVYIDDRVALPDSTVICEFLEDRFPEPALLPASAELRANARWLEEFADSRMGEVFIWRLFNNLVINRFVWGQAVDEIQLRHTIDREIPSILDYLEARLPTAGYLFGAISIADIAIASFFRNASFSKYEVDPSRWPRTRHFADHVLDHPAFSSLRPFEELSLRTPIGEHRQALLDAGAPVTSETYATGRPRRGILRT